MTDAISRQAVEKAIHDAIGRQCLQNRKTSAGEYSAVAIAAVRAIPAVASQPTQSDALREKVARAIMLHHDIDPDVFIGMHGGYDHWLNAADAALAAINEIPRQPTQSDALREENERLRALLARTVNLAEVYAEGTGTNFKEAMAEARAALQEQSK